MRTKTTEVPELKTEFNYNRLWKMLIDRGMKK